MTSAGGAGRVQPKPHRIVDHRIILTATVEDSGRVLANHLQINNSAWALSSLISQTHRGPDIAAFMPAYLLCWC